VEWLRGGLVLKAHRLLYHSTLGSRVIKKKKRVEDLNVFAVARHQVVDQVLGRQLGQDRAAVGSG